MAGKGNKRVPTMHDVAVLAGVSVATVSHVLNSESEKFVSEDLREKVMTAARELGYRLNYLARGMRGKNRRTIAVLVPQFENTLFTRMVMAAERVAYEAGYVLLICSTYDNPEREKVYIDNLLSQQVDGFLIAPTVRGAVNTQPLREYNVPFVIMDRPLTGIALKSYNYVGFDNQLGAEMATQYLVDRGHRRIGYIGWRSEIQRINERHVGFRETILRNGLDPGVCPALLGAHSREEGKQLTLELLPDNPTAILAGHQYMGEGVILALRERRRSIPGDVSVVVYGRPPWTELVDPPLVCVAMPDVEIGQPAARMVIEAIESEQHEVRQLLLTPSLSPGGSVAQLPIHIVNQKQVSLGGHS